MDKKKRRKKVISWVSIALVVALLAAMPLMAKSEVQSDGPVATLYSGQVEKGSISTVLRGGGTLTAKDAQDVTIPDGVKITEFLVKNGDVVAEGDPVARVDKVSVMTAIVEVKETMETLQDKMEEARNEKVSSSVKATAGGRVKQVFAQEGDSVQEVMLEHGALAVMSLDSLMAVELSSDLPINTGDSVTVVLSDGVEITGRVESSLNGVIVITVEDEGYAIGETVTVKTGDGAEVGTGQLYVHNAWKATAFTGTVSRVSAKAEKEVYAGAVLFTLKDTEFAAQLEYLSNQHREYEKLMQQLFRMYESETLCAPCDGQVSGVEKDSPHLLSGGNADWEAVPLENTAQEKSWTVMLLSDVKPSEPDSGAQSGKEPDSEETQPADGLCMGFAGRVTQVGRDEIIATMSQLGAEVIWTEEGGWDLSQVDMNPQNMIHSGMTFPIGEGETYAVGDIIVVIYEEATGNVSITVAQKAEPEEDDATQPTLPGGTQLPDGNTGSTGGFGGSDISGLMGSLMGGYPTMGSMGTATEETEEELFNLEGEVLLTVTPQETVSLTITLDEQDISKVFVGQSAQIKVEALRGQSFEAEVTEVSISGSNSGGSSKFTARLELPKAENMLDGMSATASLPLYTRMDVLTVPVKALDQQGARTVVYTALDSETGEPSAPVEVTTGLSDGENVEILAGLQLGDSFYYSYYDTLELDTNAEVSRFTFGG